ncbi:MAG: magnesium and cobalt transport protein CorA [Candidatus Altiarchaeales archaeon WOR_SM1_86-2]|nr:MAG: magnesium and cobalt transport protein CorA [Candidatus Altiarchaeales archaeon WOR_SM1_86-2]ODS40736.1 MAG: magnesium and cobalt transport protein CorA [Candidatus Altiarchaeales archaeon WOR_SM1_79]
MVGVIKKRSKKAGLPPGALVHIGKKKTEKVDITVIDYDEKNFQEKKVKTIEECFPFKDKPTVTWINIDGIHDVEIIEKLGKHFGLHPLLLEDILNTDQRPKMEDFGDYIFVVLKMLDYDENKDEIKSEQVSLILGSNYVISFQESVGDVFDPARERIRNGKGRMRKMGADYLIYSLMDAIVDEYFIILEKIGEKIEDMEEELVTNPTPETLHIIHKLKRDMIFLRKSVWPLREVINGMQRAESPLIRESTGIYLRDVHDHTIQVIDTIETYRDMISGMLDIYLSSISNKMNEVMKVLTIIATIFIPLTYIAGIYGMNFRYMPELEWRWGYFVVLLFMAVIGILMVVYFRRKRWL